MTANTPTADQKLASLAAGQHGAFSAAQAREQGLSDKQVGSRVRSGRWERTAARGVYVMTGTPDNERRRASVALLAGPSEAVLSHRSAAALHGLVEFPTVPVVTVGRRSAGRSPCATVHRGTVGPADVVEIDGLRCTSAARTALDLAAICSYRVLTDILDDMLTRPLTTPEEVRRAMGRAVRGPGRRGEAALLRALEVWIPGAVPGSRPEMRLIRILVERGLPAPVRQYVIRDGHGREIARVDVCWPDARLIGEYDGGLFHGPRRAVADADRQRAVEELGWRVERVRKQDLKDPARLCARFRSALGARAA